MTRGRSLCLLGAAVVASVLALAAASCSSSGPDDVSVTGTLPPDTARRGPGGTGTVAPGTIEPPGTIVDDARADDTRIPPTTYPDPTDPSSVTTPSTPSPPPGEPIDCGSYNRAGGWPTTLVPPPTIADCFVQAFDAGTPAVAEYSEQTDGHGGAPIVTRYEVIGVRRARVTIDATRAAGQPQDRTVLECTNVFTRDYVLAHDSCTPTP